MHILLENGKPAAVVRDLQSFQQNHAIEDTLIHEFAKLRLVRIQFGKALCFRRRALFAVDVLAGGVFGNPEHFTDDLGAFLALFFSLYHENRSTP